MATVVSEPAVSTREALPELYEIVGELVLEKPPMSALAAVLASRLMAFLAAHVQPRALGLVVSETLFDLRPAIPRSRRPDLAFVSVARWPLRRLPPEGEAWAVVPDLAIEVVSPSNTVDELVEKAEEYRLAGVRAIWVVHPARGIIDVLDAADPGTWRRLRLDAADALGGGSLLPGFELPLAEFFANEDAETGPAA